MATQWTAGTTSGQVLTAAKLNTIGAAWETYTPTPVQNNFVTSFTTNYSKYAQIGKTIFVNQKITFTGSTGATGGQPIISNLPFTAAAGAGLTGSFYYFRAGVANYGGPVTGYPLNSSWLQFILPNDSLIGQSPNFIVANTHILQFSVTYETT